MQQVVEDIPKRYQHYMQSWLIDPNKMNLKQNNMLSAYLEFSMRPTVAITKQLIAIGNDPSNVDSDGDTVLHCALVNPFCDLAIVEMLFEAAPESFYVFNYEYENPLMKYVEKNRCKPEITGFLISKTKSLLS